MKANPPSRNGRSSSRHYHPMESKSLSEIVGADTGGPRGQRLNEEGHTPAHYSVFVDLVSKMLAYDPEDRIKPSDALLHPFITNVDATAGGADDKARRSRSAPIGTRGKPGEGSRK
jgi:serine/threonine protein kinase